MIMHYMIFSVFQIGPFPIFHVDKFARMAIFFHLLNLFCGEICVNDHIKNTYLLPQKSTSISIKQQQKLKVERSNHRQTRRDIQCF